ncbi:MAG: reverse transcriptase-like protein [Spirochaetia bacterium]|jgi:ribonuclease HI|nr:reverse transcriptase-like protein [Spirochaetia bacterium]
MLPSIDRVLQLLSEGKPVEKIAELASCEDGDILDIIKQARSLMASLDKSSARKKIIIKRKPSLSSSFSAADADIDRLLTGTELAAVPMESSLTFYVAGESDSKTKHSAIGVVIHDEEGRQLGKVSMYIGKSGKYSTLYYGILKSLKIAGFFGTKDLKIRISSDTVRGHFSNEISIDDPKLAKQLEEARALMNDFPECRLENIPVNQNEKAHYLAAGAIERLLNRQ